MKRKHPSEASSLDDKNMNQKAENEEISVENILQRILNSSNYFDRLELSKELHTPQTIRLAYKKLALLVHPGM
jgi:hypothetical protein